MHIRIIEGDSTDKIRASCYTYLRELYQKKLVDEARKNKANFTATDEHKEVVPDGHSIIRASLDRRPS